MLGSSSCLTPSSLRSSKAWIATASCGAVRSSGAMPSAKGMAPHVTSHGGVPGAPNKPDAFVMMPSRVNCRKWRVSGPAAGPACVDTFSKHEAYGRSMSERIAPPPSSSVLRPQLSAESAPFTPLSGTLKYAVECELSLSSRPLLPPPHATARHWRGLSWFRGTTMGASVSTGSKPMAGIQPPVWLCRPPQVSVSRSRRRLGSSQPTQRPPMARLPFGQRPHTPSTNSLREGLGGWPSTSMSGQRMQAPS